MCTARKLTQMAPSFHKKNLSPRINSQKFRILYEIPSAIKTIRLRAIFLWEFWQQSSRIQARECLIFLNHFSLNTWVKDYFIGFSFSLRLLIEFLAVWKNFVSQKFLEEFWTFTKRFISTGKKSFRTHFKNSSPHARRGF